MEKYALVFLTDGFEEIEALATVDILRRGGVNTFTVSLDSSKMVKGAHDITVISDILFDEISGEYDALILPGGAGHKNYFPHSGLKNLLTDYSDKGKIIAAICAAPTYLAAIGLLDGKRGVCFPGMETHLTKALPGDGAVVKDGNIITSKCPVTALNFGLFLLKEIAGDKKYKEIYNSMHFELMERP